MEDVNFRFIAFMASRYFLSWRKQTVVIIAAVTGATFLYLLSYSMLNGLTEVTLSRSLGLAVPHVEVRINESRLEGLTDVLEGYSVVEAYSPRILCEALAVHEEYSHGVRLIGVYDLMEHNTSGIDEYIVEGDWLIENYTCILGVKLAEELRVDVGENVTVILPSGRPWMLRVSGIFDTGVAELDSYIVYVSLPKLRDLTGLKSLVVAVRLRDPFKSDSLAEDLRSMGYDAKPWSELAENILQLLEVESFYSNALIGSILVITGLGIVNVMIMLTESRKRSIGILKAIGASSMEVFLIYLLVSVLWGILGYLAGTALALATASYLREATVEYFSLKVPFRFSSGIFFSALLFSLTISSISCSYSAYRASRIRPAEVMRFE